MLNVKYGADYEQVGQTQYNVLRLHYIVFQHVMLEHCSFGEGIASFVTKNIEIAVKELIKQ